MNKDDIKFQIDQLRKDKMIYALESIALTFLMEISYIFIVMIFDLRYSVKLAAFCLLVSASYFVFMTVGNILRYLKIRKLEKSLYKK